MALRWLWWRASAGISRRRRRGTLRGRRGTWRHPPSFVALGKHLLSFHVAGVALMALGALGLGLVAADAAALCVAGVALGDIHLCFTWQAWHLETSTFVLRGRRGTYGTALALVARFGWDYSPATPRHFAWQVWHLATSTFVSRGTWKHLLSFSRGRRGTYGTGLALAARLDPPSLTQHLSHTTLSHTIFDRPLCHTHHL